MEMIVNVRYLRNKSGMNFFQINEKNSFAKYFHQDKLSIKVFEQSLRIKKER